jgi:hypothetical protein
MAGTRRLEIVIAGKADGATKAMGQVGKGADHMGTKMSSAGKVLAASFAGAGLAAVAFAKKSSDQFRKYGMEVGKLSRYTGASVEESSKLAVAFQQSGISAEQGTKAIGIFSKKIVASKDTMAQWGIKTRDATGQIRPMSKILEDAADKIANTKNATEKLALAQSMFGKGGADMIKVLGKGSAGMRELAAEAERFGLVLTKDNISAVKKATDAARDQELAYQGLQIQIGQYVTPAITKMTTAIAEGIPMATGFIEDHKAAFEVLGGAVTVVTGIFLIYKAAVVATSIAQGAATAVAITYKAVTGALSGVLDMAAVAAYNAAGGFNATAMGMGEATAAAGALRLGYGALGLAAVSLSKDQMEWDNHLDAIAKKLNLYGSGSADASVLTALLGQSLQEAAINALKGQSAWGKFKGALTGDDKISKAKDVLKLYDKTLTDMISHGSKPEAIAAFTRLALSLEANGTSAADVARLFPGMTAAMSDAELKAAGLSTKANDAADATGETGDAAEKAAPKVKTLAEKWADVASAVDDATSKLDTLYGRTTSGIEGRIEANAALMDFTSGLKENGTVLNENTKAGQDNYKAAISARDAAIDYAKTLAESGDIQGAIKYAEDYGKVLGAQAKAAGLSDEATADLIETLGLTPRQVEIAFGAAGYKEAKQKAIDLTNNANAAAAKRFLNWVANTKDPEKKARELKKIADDAAAKRFLDWYANTATAQQKVDVFFADLAKKPKNFWVNVNATISTNGQRVPAFASGTLSAPSGFALVGEQGPELVRFSGGERVYTASQTASMAGRGGTAVMDRPIVVENYVYLDGKQIEGTVRSHAQDREARTGKAWTA